MCIYIYIICVCVCHPCTNGLSNFAGSRRATGWLGPTKTHPVCCVNVPEELLMGHRMAAWELN